MPSPMRGFDYEKSLPVPNQHKPGPIQQMSATLFRVSVVLDFEFIGKGSGLSE